MPKWIASWHASLTKFDTHFFAFTFPQVSFENQTLRMVIHPHASGAQLRLKFSNRYGVEPLFIGGVTIAHHMQDGNVVPQTAVAVSFQECPDVTIPAGEDRYSDPVSFNVDAMSDLVVSVYLPSHTKTSNWHWTPAQSTYVAAGNQIKEHDARYFTTCIDSYYWLNGLDVITEEENARVIVALGDSITEGFSATLNASHRWPDYFQRYIHQNYPDALISIVNAGITGNLITINGDDVDISIAGEKTLTRLYWDVFAQSGVTDVIFFQGINDIFGETNADQIIAGIKEVASKLHHQNIQVFIGTITPFENSHYFSEAKEQIRQKVNAWIRSNSIFDGIVDFDQVLADPQMPNQLFAAYDSGDHVHPGDDGFKAIAHAIPLTFFVK